jgi:2-amino-4-hydroxy-6-hydroxymethyldihydropteridine diphosphokinase
LKESARYATLVVYVWSEAMRVHLSLGSNLGDRRANLRRALAALEAKDGVRITARSRCYETAPQDRCNQPSFLNLAAEIETDLEPLELLEAIKGIERELGRTLGERWGPRPIDIDIVLWGARTLETEALTLPHPRFRQRAFVLTPLAEIAGDAADPVSGLTVTELAARPEAEGFVGRPIELDH